MKIKKKEIKFFANNDFILNSCLPPVSAKQTIPKWYKNANRYTYGDKLIIQDNGGTNVGVKVCVPFLDAITNGYTIRLHCDILVEWDENGQFHLKWTSNEKPLSSRSEAVSSQIPTLSGYTGFTQAWELKYSFVVPRGYSVLVTQPLNGFDLPTYVTSGIMDSDDFCGPGGIPFAIRKDFSGIIKAGTPIMQLIPIKRDKWKSSLKVQTLEQESGLGPRNYIVGWYKENIWKRKSYE